MTTLTHNRAHIALAIDRLIEAGLIALLAFMPLAFGAVDAWSEEVVVVATFAIFLAFGIRLVLDPADRIVGTWAYLAIVAFVGLILFQLVPLPSNVLHWISPRTLSLHEWLLGDGQNSARVVKAPLSFYPYATQHDLRLVLCAAALFVVSVNIFNCPARIKRLLVAIGTIGTVVAAVSLAQVFTGDNKVYWIIPAQHRDSGPFANHSHLGQFMNLSIGALIALACVRFSELRASSRDGTTSAATVFQRRWKEIVLPLAGVALCFTAICFSLTRGGMLAFFTAGAITLPIAAYQLRIKQGLWLTAGLALCAAILIGAGGFDLVFNRLQTLNGVAETDLRPKMLSDLYTAWKALPVFGSGLGSHIFVYPMFQTMLVANTAVHADNEYAQLFEEVGGVGLLVVASFIAIIVIAYVKNIGRNRRPIRAAALGLGFGWIAILMQSASDFGQHLPAMACLSAVSAGLLVSLSKIRRENNRPTADAGIPSRLTPWLRLAGVAAILCVGVRVIPDADLARRAEASWSLAVAIDKTIPNGAGSDAQFRALLGASGAACQNAPGNAWYAYWNNAFRWQAVSRLCGIQGSHADEANQQLVSFTQKIVDDALASRTLCPPMPLNNMLCGQLKTDVLLDVAAGLPLTQLAAMQSPSSANTLYTYGIALAKHVDVNQAVPYFDRCIRADAAYRDKVVTALCDDLHRPDVAVMLNNDDSEFVAFLYGYLRRSGGAGSAETKSLLASLANRADLNPLMIVSLAEAALAADEPAEALAYFRRALAIRPNEMHWRMAYARTLMKVGDFNNALIETRTCLAIQPQRKDANALLCEVKLAMAASQSRQTRGRG